MIEFLVETWEMIREIILDREAPHGLNREFVGNLFADIFAIFLRTVIIAIPIAVLAGLVGWAWWYRPKRKFVQALAEDVKTLVVASDLMNTTVLEMYKATVAPSQVRLLQETEIRDTTHASRFETVARRIENRLNTHDYLVRDKELLSNAMMATANLIGVAQEMKQTVTLLVAHRRRNSDNNTLEELNCVNLLLSQLQVGAQHSIMLAQNTSNICLRVSRYYYLRKAKPIVDMAERFFGKIDMSLRELSDKREKLRKGDVK